MPRISSFKRFVAVHADGDDQCAPGLRPAMRSTLPHDAIGLEAVGGKVQDREARQPVTMASKISSMSGRRKISPPVRSTQLTSGFSRTSATISSVVSSSDGFRCQMLHVLHRYWHQ